MEKILDFFLNKEIDISISHEEEVLVIRLSRKDHKGFAIRIKESAILLIARIAAKIRKIFKKEET